MGYSVFLGAELNMKVRYKSHLEVILDLQNLHFILVNVKQLHFLYFGRFSFQVIKPKKLKSLLLHIAMTELIQASASPGYAFPDTKQAFAALSFQLCT